ncbi:malic enzyme-like NAD(P)-binding protein [Viridibacillus sp. NPDC093762]|uniref:malic enzyme-like NAD(P)-binding protein n=1 Tax=Viridibacillus sp. NPDC093762 TaxID=3390720 RepID=UPI003CFDA83D
MRIFATGRSDYPNQINNLLAFPGIFRGALDVHASEINEEMKLAAVFAMASLIDENDLAQGTIIPGALDERVAPIVAKAVSESAIKTGVAKKPVAIENK